MGFIMNQIPSKIMPQSPTECSEAFLGVQLDAKYRYLIVSDENGKFSLRSVSGAHFEDIPEQNLIQKSQFQSVILKARSGYKIKSLKNLQLIPKENLKKTNMIEANSEIITSIFFDRVKPLIKGDEQFYRNAFANFIEWHMMSYFFCQKEEVPQNIEDTIKQKPSLPKTKSKFSLPVISGSTIECSSPRRNSSRIIKINARQEAALKSLGKEGLELCHYLWINNCKMPENSLWKDRITLGEYERMEKNGFFKTPLMNDLIQEQISRMIIPSFNKYSLSGDIKRNLHHVSIFSEEKPLLSKADFLEFPKERFKIILKNILTSINVPKDILKNIINKWDKFEKEEKDSDFHSLCQSFINNLGDNNYENKLFMLLAVLTQQTYVFPILSIKEIIPEIPIEYQDETKILRYMFSSSEGIKFYASFFVNLSPNIKNCCPYFEMEAFNLLRFTDQGVWRSELEFRLHIDKNVDKKQIDALILDPLLKTGFNVQVIWKVSTSNSLVRL